MAQFRDIDLPTGVKLRVNGDLLIPSSYSLIAEGTISGNQIVENGDALVNKYLGMYDTANNSYMLGGLLPEFYLRKDIGGTVSAKVTVSSGGLQVLSGGIDSSTTVIYGTSVSRGRLSYGTTGLITLEAVSTNTSIDLKSSGTGNVLVNGQAIWHAGNFNPSSMSNDWANITNKPATFPPSSHTHSAATDIIQSSNFRLVSDTEKSSWNEKVSPIIALANGVDLNTCTTSGFYSLGSTHTPVPPTGYSDAKMIVTGYGQYITQMLLYTNSNSSTDMFIRNSTVNRGSMEWTNWQQVHTSSSFSVSNYVRNNLSGQQVTGDFSVVGNSTLYVGTGASNSGSLVVRNNGANGIQLAGSNAAKLSGVNAYINASGNAEFAGHVSAASISVASSVMVTNLNANYLAGKTELDFAKTESIYETSGSGVQEGLSVLAQSPTPNMSVRITAGVVYTDTGRRYVVPQTDQSITAASATYGRRDIVFIYGSKNSAGNPSGALEGTIGYVAGTPAASPVDPTVPVGAVKLARITVNQNMGTVQNANISMLGEWRQFSYDGAGFHVRRQPLSIESNITSDTASVTITKPIQGTTWAKTFTIPAGQQSVTWNHLMGLGTNYVLALSCDSPNRHVYWKNRIAASVELWLDDITDVPITVHAIMFAT